MIARLRAFAELEQRVPSVVGGTVLEQDLAPDSLSIARREPCPDRRTAVSHCRIVRRVRAGFRLPVAAASRRRPARHRCRRCRAEVPSRRRWPAGSTKRRLRPSIGRTPQPACEPGRRADPASPPPRLAESPERTLRSPLSGCASRNSPNVARASRRRSPASAPASRSCRAQAGRRRHRVRRPRPRSLPAMSGWCRSARAFQ